MEENYKKILLDIINNGEIIDEFNHLETNILSIYNYNLKLNKKEFNEFINIIPGDLKHKFECEFNLFFNGETNISEYNKNLIKYWDYCKPKLLNSYPDYYPEFNNIIKNFNNKYSKNHILYLGNNKKSNQQSCLSVIQFQRTKNNQLIISAFQRSCDANLGFLADLYHLELFRQKIFMPLKELNILYGNLHIYLQNLNSTKDYLNSFHNYYEFKFKQINKK